MVRFQPKIPVRRFLSGTAPEPYRAPADNSPPVLGQRKRAKRRRVKLSPTPLKA